MLHRLPCVPLSAEEHGPGTGGRLERELVEREALPARVEDALPRGLREAQRGDGELGDHGEAHVVGDGADLHDDFGIALGRVGGLLGDAREGDGGLVDFGEEQAVQDGLAMRFRSGLV